jgi:hypothetical protein
MLKIEKMLILIGLLLISRLACACGSDIQQESMAKRLYADPDMRKFICAGESCSTQDFRRRLQFRKYAERYHGRTLPICVIEPTLSATNSYTGVFASEGDGFQFQLISYGTGIKIGADNDGTPSIFEYSFDDPDNPDNSFNQYLWNGKAFVFVKNVSLPN